MKALFSTLIALAILATSAFAETPEDTLKQYYEYARWKKLDEYYSVIDTESMTKSELASRKEITELLWQKMTPVEYSLDGLKITEKDGFAIARYTIKAQIMGHGSVMELMSSGGEPKEIIMPTAAILIKRGDGWKVLTTSDPQRLNNTLQSLMVAKQARIVNDIVPKEPESKELKMTVEPAVVKGEESQWETTLSHLTLIQNEDNVTGNYGSRGGKITGTMQEGVIKGWWTQDNRKKKCGPDKQWSGPVIFTFDVNATSFSGFYSRCKKGEVNYDDLWRGSTWDGSVKSGSINLGLP